MSPGEMIDDAIEQGTVRLREMYGDEFDAFTDGCPPTILYAPYAYGSTAGPFGGIGGQMISSFPHVTVMWEQTYTYVYVGGSKGFGGKLTAEFYQRVMRGENPWNLARFLKKEPQND